MTTQRKEGVYYRTADCSGVFRRLFIQAVDFVALAALIAGLWWGTGFSEVLDEALVPASFALGYAYLAGLKATRFGTLGYLLADVRLVDLQGRQASLWRSTFRFGFLVFGPLNLLFDLIWVGGDPNRQSIRDKFAGTYVIRRRAIPAGRGPIDYKTYFLMSYSLVFPEVVRRPDAGGKSPA